ncbi:MAG: polysaccharide deacetylase [Ruminococcaceae bacterium]|nr:polysaccharide deacetylase [Oscillospiraceae bacterium]
MQRRYKAVTFSYDDGVTQDQRLIDLFNRYGVKGTFNINSGLLGTHNSLIRQDVTVAHVKPRPEEIRKIYEGHEIAAHTLTHPFLPGCDDAEIIRQVEEDRLALSELAGYEVVGMAYPGGGVNFNEHVADVIRNNTGIRYCRTTVSSFDFEPQADLWQFKPSVYHHMEWDKMEELARTFVEMKADRPQIFYIWGHAYEFDIFNDWARFERFLSLIGGHDDIFYGTNREVLLKDWQ